MHGLIGAATALRLAGFLSVVAGVKAPAMLGLQFFALAATISIGLWQISRGKAVEHAVFITRIANAVSERMARATAS
jgi:cytochrome oxidase assembly protein ShyY1